jgi:hypothetical protein
VQRTPRKKFLGEIVATKQSRPLKLMNSIRIKFSLAPFPISCGEGMNFRAERREGE